MTQQTYGELLFKGINPTAELYVYTPWMPCQGDAAVFGVQIIKITGSLTVSWNVETKAVTALDSAATRLLDDDQEDATAGVKYSGGGTSEALDGCSELYRYCFATGSGFSTTEWVILRELAPSWQQDGRA